MIPEDIMVALQSLAASDNMNDRQRTVMTEAAACIKFQQHRVAEAERKQREAEEHHKNIASICEVLKERMDGVAALNDYFRQNLVNLSGLRLVPTSGELSDVQ